MYTIFFTINCVEQLTFFKAFVDQLKFEQTLIFCLKVKLLDIIFQYTYGRWFLIFDRFSLFCQLLNLRRAVDIFMSTSFFELSNFEQLIISRLLPFYPGNKVFWDISNQNIRPFFFRGLFFNRSCIVFIHLCLFRSHFLWPEKFQNILKGFSGELFP